MTPLRLQLRYLASLPIGSQADPVWIATFPRGAREVLEVHEQLDGVEPGAAYRRVLVDDREVPYLKLHAATTEVHRSRRGAEMEQEATDVLQSRRRMGFARW